PGFFLVPVLTAERCLGAFLAGDPILLRREHGFPFGVGLAYLVCHDSVSLVAGCLAAKCVAGYWSAAAASRSLRAAADSRTGPCTSRALMRRCMDFTLGAIAERRAAAPRRC